MAAFGTANFVTEWTDGQASRPAARLLSEGNSSPDESPDPLREIRLTGLQKNLSGAVITRDHCTSSFHQHRLYGVWLKSAGPQRAFDTAQTLA
jgi:hypothetical protein